MKTSVFQLSIMLLALSLLPWGSKPPAYAQGTLVNPREPRVVPEPFRGIGSVPASQLATAQAAATTSPASPPRTGGVKTGPPAAIYQSGLNADGTIGTLTSSPTIEFMKSNTVYHDGVVNPMATIKNAAGVVQYPFGGGDVFSRIVNFMVAAGYPCNVTFEIPLGVYPIGAALPLKGFCKTTVRAVGSDFYPSSAAATYPAMIRGEDNVAKVSNVKIIGGHFLANPTSGVGFTSCFADSAIDGLNTINGFEYNVEECAGTSQEGFHLESRHQKVNASYLALQNVNIHGVNFHNTGWMSVYLYGCRVCKTDDNISATPGQAGPTIPGNNPVNLECAICYQWHVRRNDISGTPLWNTQPAAYEPPPNAVYPISCQDCSITDNTIHDSQCTGTLCDTTFGRVDSLGVSHQNSWFSMPFGGTNDASTPGYPHSNYAYAGPDAIHSDTSSSITITGNKIDGYANGVVCEISLHCVVSNNKISHIWQNALFDNSRDSTVPINAFRSIAGLVPGTRVTLSVVNALPGYQHTAPGCPNSCVQAAIPANTVGSLFHQNNTNSTTSGLAWTNGYALVMLKQFAVTGPNSPIAGSYYLFLSTVMNSCADPKGITIPLPTTGPNGSYATPIGGNFFIEPPDMMQFGLSASPLNLRDTVPGWVTYCIMTTGSGNAASTLTIAGLQFQSFSSGNVYVGNTISQTGSSAMRMDGPGGPTLMASNNISGAATYGSAGSGYGFLGAIGSGALSPQGLTRTGPAFIGNIDFQDRPLSMNGIGFVAAFAISSAINNTNTIIRPVIKDTVFSAVDQNGLPNALTGINYQGTSTHSPFLDLEAAGNVGVVPNGYRNQNDDGVFEITLASGVGTYPLNFFYSHPPKFTCTNETTLAPILCKTVALSGGGLNQYQVNISDGTSSGTETVLLVPAKTNKFQ